MVCTDLRRHITFMAATATTSPTSDAAVGSAQPKHPTGFPTKGAAGAAAAQAQRLPFWDQLCYLKLMLGREDLLVGRKALKGSAVILQSSDIGDWYLPGADSRPRKFVILAGSKQAVLDGFSRFIMSLPDSKEPWEERIAFLVPKITATHFATQWASKTSGRRAPRAVFGKPVPNGETKIQMMGALKQDILPFTQVLLDVLEAYDVEVLRSHASTSYLPRHLRVKTQIRVAIPGDRQRAQVIGPGGSFLKHLRHEFVVDAVVPEDADYLELSGLLGDVWAAQAATAQMWYNRMREQQRWEE